MMTLKHISKSGLKLLFVAIAVVFLASCGKEGKNDSLVASDVASESSLTDGAEVQKTKYASGCIGCQILVMIYDEVGAQVMQMHTDFTKASMPIMIVAFSIWLALRLLKFVSSVSEANVGEVWNEILKKLFVCMLCGFIAATPAALQTFVNLVVFPIYGAFLELGLKILQASTDTTQNSISLTVFGETVSIEDANLTCELNNSFTLGNSGFPAELRDGMTCQVQILRKYLTLGSDVSLKTMRDPTYIARIPGLIMYVFFMLVRFGMVFYLVDSIFKMGIIILMLPLFVLSYAFGPTKKWATIGFTNIIAASGFMMCFSVIVSMCLVAMVSLINGSPELFNPTDPEYSLKNLSLGYMCLLLIGFLIYGSMGVSQAMVSGLLGASMSNNFQKNLKAAVQTGLQLIWSGISSLVTWGVSLLPDTSFRMIRQLNERRKALMAKLDRWAGRD